MVWDRLSSSRSSSETISGGLETMRGCPSTMRVSFARASMLSRVRALATTFPARLRVRASTSPATVGTRVSTSTRAYQTSMLRAAANCAISARYDPAVSSMPRSRSRCDEPAFAPRDRDARHQSLEIPLPRARERLVEIVDVEDQAPLGRAEEAEVRKVGIAAALNVEAGTRRRREVGGHDRRCAAIERERRGEHAPVADRHELGDARRRLRLEDADRIRSVPGRLVRLPWLERGTALRAARPRSARSAAVACVVMAAILPPARPRGPAI